jgi:hypothetical protein
MAIRLEKFCPRPIGSISNSFARPGASAMKRFDIRANGRHSGV